MAGRVNYNSLIEFLQRSMASQARGQERPNATQDGHDCYCGYGCDSTCYFDGHGDNTYTGHTIVQIVEVPVPSVVMKDSDRWYNKVYKFSFYVLLILLLLLYFLRVNRPL
jgi:hypothetical protein